MEPRNKPQVPGRMPGAWWGPSWEGTSTGHLRPGALRGPGRVSGAALEMPRGEPVAGERGLGRRQAPPAPGGQSLRRRRAGSS